MHHHLLVLSLVAQAQDTTVEEFQHDLEYLYPMDRRIFDGGHNTLDVLSSTGDQAALDQAVRELQERINYQISESNRRLESCFSNSKAALERLIGQSYVMSNLSGLIGLEQQLGVSTNIMADTDLRNGLDWSRDIGTILGLAAAAVGAGLMASDADGDAGAITVAAGGGLAGVAQFVGLFAPSNKIEEKLIFIEVARTAYDDLRRRSQATQAYRMSVKQLISRMEIFREKYSQPISDETVDMALQQEPDRPGESSDEKTERVRRLLQLNRYRSRLAQVAQFLVEVDVFASFVPDTLRHFRIVVARWESIPGHEKVPRLLETKSLVEERTAELLEEYNKKVRPFISLSAESRALLICQGG